MKGRMVWQWLIVLPVGLALGCTAPADPPPSLPSSVSPTSLSRDAIERLREEVEEADEAVRNAASYLDRECPTAPPTVPVDEEMCRQIKPDPYSPKGKLITAENHCNELVARYNEAVTTSDVPQSEKITLGVTLNRKYGNTITCSAS